MKNNAATCRKLTKYSIAVKGLSTLTKTIAQDTSDDLLRALKSEHLDGNDPYGRKWVPRIHSYTHPILNKTGRLIHSTTVKITNGDDLSISNRVPYAIFHQNGTGNLPIRSIVPTSRRGFPKEWMSIFRRALQKQWSQRMKGVK